jgi:hypothetical protein
MTAYQITINMDDTTVDTLQQDGYQLYAFKAVQGPGSGVPVVWFSTDVFSDSTVLQWSESYQAYTSQSVALGTNIQITASASYPITLGQVLNVTNPTGTGVVAEGPDPQAVAINNTTSTPFVCGISEAMASGAYQPLCAVPLPGNMEDLIVPIEQVFLVFSTLPINTGTVIEQSYSSGVLVDLTSSASQSVSFDINQGWTAEPWATVYPPNTNLVPLLIVS